MRILIRPAVLALALALCAVPALAAPLSVGVSVAPQKFIVEKIAGPLAEVFVMVGSGADAHTFEPKPGQMAQVAKARLYVAQGVDFEEVWLPKLTQSNPSLQVVQANQGVDLLPLEEHEHGHGKKGHGKQDEKQHHLETDPHTWTSPALAQVQAANVALALERLDPANAQTYRANLEAFRAFCRDLDAKLRAELGQVPPGSEFLVFHPAWAYFAKDHGLREVAIESGGKEPSARKLKELIEHAREHKARAVFVQPQFSARTAQTIADALGAKLVTADDLAPDWDQNLLRVAKALREALQ
ncbi:High-affinity zinc uptake system binding-protein ZnuA [Fundidesulfovibrio magnetotacticus]|uniref:High-affinity zinc uptake system binding-protein ZnuA n=1 Tax=Fundidesulfovibrio magnetotacticus TaxID=2730080 RepID=A0A6V8LUL3_9BACT|nr:zinc ABC transporter substrate-binding protein [Fundidesulfovibrio magnetotacticus]GFK94640.1 High-affinity zinc uptake system binding-protein ZnuA [Fundidesulfovibrio magnetotacticus]